MGTLASLTDATAQCTIGIAPADGAKCDRCWKFYPGLSSGGSYPGTCERCATVLTKMKFPPVELTPATPEAEAWLTN